MHQRIQGVLGVRLGDPCHLYDVTPSASQWFGGASVSADVLARWLEEGLRCMHWEQLSSELKWLAFRCAVPPV